MNQRLLTKILAAMLAVTLTFANFILLGVYATDAGLENQKTITNNENVEFDAYFKDDKENKIHQVTYNFNEQNYMLNLFLQVKKGYLKNAKVQITGENNTLSNLQIINSNETLELIEKIDTQTNTITLKQLNSDSQVILQIPIKALEQENYDLSNFSKINEIKLTGSYVGNDGKVTQIEKTIQTRNEWTQEIKPVLEQEVTKFIPYEVGENSGTIVQTIIKTGIENNTLPTKETIIKIKVPTINEKQPETIFVTSNGTKATNGQEGIKFTDKQWDYDKTNQIITIKVNNEPTGNQVSWMKNVKDEYVVTYNYAEKIQQIDTVQEVVLNITAYSSVECKTNKQETLNINVQEKVGEIVTTHIFTDEAISKGFLYNNSEKEISYNEKTSVEITDINLADEIVINQNIDNFVDENGNIYPANAYYKSTKISKENFEKILGTQGSIHIYSNDGAQLGTFDKTTIADEHGDYVFTYTTEVKQIKIKINNPVQNGKLEIKHIKNLKGQTDYSKTQIATFKTLETKTQIEAYLDRAMVSTKETKANINLVDPTTQIEVSTSTNTLSTVVENKNVELRVILKTNNVTCDLYKNPVVEIHLPSYVEKLEIKDIKLLFDEELKLGNYVTDLNGRIIRVELKGEQTKYSQDEIAKGANLVINANITLNKLSPSKAENMEVYVINENAVNYSKTKDILYTKAETLLKAVAPTGIITTNTIENFNANGDTVTSFNGKEEIGKLETKTKQKEATVKMNIINNYSNKLNNIVVLGRIPVKENKNPETGENLGSNLTTTLKDAITVNGIDASKLAIYYTTNVDATKDLADTKNGWTTAVEDFATIKSYLIVLNGHEMNSGESIDISYNITLPEQLPHNLSTYAIYTMYFDNVKEEEILNEKVTATKVGLTTGQGPELEATIVGQNESVEEGKKAKYNIEIKNIGKVEAKNIKVSITSKQGNRKEKIEEKVIETLSAGNTETITYEVEAKTILLEGVKENIEISSIVTADYLEKSIQTQKITTPVTLGYLSLELDTGNIEISDDRREGDTVDYVLRIKNVNAVKKENVVIKNILPEGLTLVNATQNAKYDEQTRTITCDLGTLEAFESKMFIVTTTVDKLTDGESDKKITNKMTVTTKDKTVETEEISFRIVKPALEIKQTSGTKTQVEVGDIITYNVVIKNTGSGKANNIRITDVIPEGLTYEEAQYSVGETTNSMTIGNNEARIVIPTLNANETIDLTIKMKAKELAKGEKDREVTNQISVTAEGIDEIKSNEIKHIIVAKSDKVEDPSADKVEENTYKISGKVWLDENQNGKQDETEQNVKEIKVTLINAENGKIVTDITTGKNKEQTTKENGTYSFANIQPGKYMVIFEYDTNYYGLTIYKQEGVNDNMNSDVVQANAIIHGNTKTVGTTEKIVIKDNNQDNIDMGLVINPKFDLRLDKVITKITAQTKNETNSYEYKDSKFAKLDLKDKTLDGTNIMIEYKIRVTNEGDIAGYAKKIVDYLPKDMKFSSELNPDWYQSTTGNIYNSSLASVLILPGETKELTLLLTKKITDENLGLINNNAEICESYNDLGLGDVDSIPANKVQSEDDISYADAMIGVKTGEVYIYITVSLICLVMVGLGIYIINKKVLRRI